MMNRVFFLFGGERMDSKKNFPGNTKMLILKLLDEKDMYGHQVVVELAQRTDNAFNIRTGILYPIIHDLENKGMVSSYRGEADNGKERKYYRITDRGRELLNNKWAEWNEYTISINRVMKGDVQLATE
jgi:DNA-binding PadR family transcriptional regulator